MMAILTGILKNRDITLPTKVHLVKAMVFPIVMYGYESRTIKEAQCRRIDAFELQCWRRLLRISWTARKSNQSFPFYCFPLFLCTDHWGRPSYLSLLFFGTLNSNGYSLPFLLNLRSILKVRDITLLKKFHIVKAKAFSVVIYRCEIQTIRKAEHQITDAFELRCWRRLLRAPWTARRSNQSILKEISSEYSLEGLMLKLQYSGPPDAKN